MKVQSLSICVPSGCPNNCKFCVSKVHPSNYSNQIEDNIRFRHLYEQDYLKRLQFARDNGCNTVILTGDGEPLYNRNFLTDFSHWNKMIDNPFRWIEIQTSGVSLTDEYLRYLRNTVGVTTIALSLSDVFDSEVNRTINRTPQSIKVNIDSLCYEIKCYDFNLRLCLNMTSIYNREPIERIIYRAKMLQANQVLFRKLYTSDDNCPQNKWIEEHRYINFKKLQKYIQKYGRALEVLPFGAMRYSISEMSVVIDSDCMSTQVKDSAKYLILRPDCKLYTKWDDKGSLLF